MNTLTCLSILVAVTAQALGLPSDVHTFDKRDNPSMPRDCSMAVPKDYKCKSGYDVERVALARGMGTYAINWDFKVCYMRKCIPFPMWTTGRCPDIMPLTYTHDRPVAASSTPYLCCDHASYDIPFGQKCPAKTHIQVAVGDIVRCNKIEAAADGVMPRHTTKYVPKPALAKKLKEEFTNAKFLTGLGLTPPVGATAEELAEWKASNAEYLASEETGQGFKKPKV